ncbi:MAG TPA: hypothetical protein VMD02_05065 [Candidatus Omnitrophota bacterium]|nr:hypothetical protein [Candidatus Omnitrophota bacterium]
MIAGSSNVQLNVVRPSMSRLPQNVVDATRLLVRPESGTTVDMRKAALTQVMASPEINLSEKRTILTYLSFDDALRTEVGAQVKTIVSDPLLIKIASPIRRSIRHDIIQQLANHGQMLDGAQIGDMDEARDVLTVLSAVQSPMQTGAGMIFARLFPGEEIPNKLPLIGRKPANGEKPAPIAPPLPQPIPVVDHANTIDNGLLAPVTAIKGELDSLLTTVAGLAEAFRKVDAALAEHAGKADAIKKHYDSDPDYKNAAERLTETIEEVARRKKWLADKSSELGDMTAPAYFAFHGKQYDASLLKPIELQYELSILPDQLKVEVHTVQKGIELASKQLLTIVDSFVKLLPGIVTAFRSEKEVAKDLAAFGHIPEIVEAHEKQIQKNKAVNDKIAEAQNVLFEITGRIEELRLAANHQAAKPAAPQAPVAPPAPPIQVVQPPAAPPPPPIPVKKPATPPPPPAEALAAPVPPPMPTLGIAARDYEAFFRFIINKNGAELKAKLPQIVNWLKEIKEFGNSFDDLTVKVQNEPDNLISEKICNAIAARLGPLASSGNQVANDALEALIKAS